MKTQPHIYNSLQLAINRVINKLLATKQIKSHEANFV